MPFRMPKPFLGSGAGVRSVIQTDFTVDIDILEFSLVVDVLEIGSPEVSSLSNCQLNFAPYPVRSSLLLYPTSV